MSTRAVTPRVQARAEWTRPPTLTFTSSENSESDFDPSSATISKSEPQHEPSSSAGPGGSGMNGPPSMPRGHRLAWTIPSRIVQPPSIPAFSQISISLSTLSFSHSSRSKTSLLSSSPSTPATLSSRRTTNQGETPSTPSTSPSPHLPRSLSRCSVGLVHGCPNINADDTLTDRTSANPISTNPLPASRRRSVFTTTTAAFFTSMSRPSWDPFPLVSSTSSSQPSTTTSASVSPSTSSAPIAIVSNPNPISIEDARLLDPSYLSSLPILPHSGYHYHNIGPGAGIGINSSNRGASYSYTIPYIDPQGTLHDPDYRPFPLIHQTKRSRPNPFAIRKPYWELDDEDDLESDSLIDYEGDDDPEGRPNTPTSTTPFICYFLETHPLKRQGTPLRNNTNNHLPSSSKNFGSNYDSDSRAGRGKRSKGPGGLQRTRSQLKLGTAYMYATIATGLGNRSQLSPTRTTTPLPIPQYTSTLSTSPPTMLDGKEKEKKGWGGLLWKTSSRKDGAD